MKSVGKYRRSAVVLAGLAIAMMTAPMVAASPSPQGAHFSPAPLLEAVQGFITSCRPGVRRVFFENCWWRPFVCRDARGSRSTIHRCLSCPDLPARRCPPGT